MFTLTSCVYLILMVITVVYLMSAWFLDSELSTCLNVKPNVKQPNDNKYNSGLCVFVPKFAYLS